jgi:hypothetical protein
MKFFRRENEHCQAMLSILLYAAMGSELQTSLSTYGRRSRTSGHTKKPHRIRRWNIQLLGVAFVALGLQFFSPASAVAGSVFYHFPLSDQSAQPNGGTKVFDLPPHYGGPSIGNFGGFIRVPAGQQKLVLEMVDVGSVNDCGANLYVARDKQIQIVYNDDIGSVNSSFSQYDYGGYLEKRIVINNPPAGDYYFVPWRLFRFITCPLKYAVKAEYFPPAPNLTRIAPALQEANLGGVANIAVSVAGTGLTYRWEKRLNGTTSRISSSLNASAATSTLTLTSLTASDAAEYHAIVSNTGGMITSPWSTLTVRVPPVITSQPQPKKIMPGGSAVFTVTATGTAPLSYRWEHQELNGNIGTISGVTSASLTINNVNYLTHAGAYRVWVMNSAIPGGVASIWASLTVGPSIAGLAPANPSVNEGAPLGVTASASGTAPLVYNWYLGGQLRRSGFSGTLTIASAKETDDGAWRLDVTNLAGKVSQNFAVTIVPPPTPPSFLLLPSAKALTEGETLDLESRALGSRPIAYQWFQDGAPVAGAITSSLVISNTGPQQAGQWAVSATNTLGQTTTMPVTVNISAGPKFIRQPANSEAAPGGLVTLSVEAIGRAPLGYQWFKNGQPMGATGPELTITNAARTDSGFYHVVVTNGLGTVLASLPARVTVKEGAMPVGSILWRFSCNQPKQLIVHEDGRLVFIDDDGLKSLDPDGRLEWSMPPIGSEGSFDQIMAVPGGITIVRGNLQPLSANRVFAVSSKGRLLWSAVSTNEPSPKADFLTPYSRYDSLSDGVSQIALGASNELLIVRDSFYGLILPGPLSLYGQHPVCGLGHDSAVFSISLEELNPGGNDNWTKIRSIQSGFQGQEAIFIDSDIGIPVFSCGTGIYPDKGNPHSRLAVCSDGTVIFSGYGQGSSPYMLYSLSGSLPLDSNFDQYGVISLGNSVELSYTSRTGKDRNGRYHNGDKWYKFTLPVVLALGSENETYVGGPEIIFTFKTNRLYS